MRFEYIDIKNYRQYRSLRIDFPKGEHDLQVLVGDNGTGKTNLLNSFTWCLYGTEPHLGDADKKKGEPRLNKDLILEMVRKGIGIEDVSVELAFENDGCLYVVKRSVPFRVAGINEVFERHADERLVVSVIDPAKGTKVYEDEEAAKRQIEKCLPESIREYFFFDGEQLSNYFSETRGEQIKDAIHSISQVDLVTRMKTRTDKVVSELRREAFGHSPKVGEINEKIDRYSRMLEESDGKISERQDAIAKSKEKIEELTNHLRGIEGIPALEEKRDRLRLSLDKETKNFERVQSEYKAFARDSFINFSFYEVADKTLKVIEALEAERSLPPAIDKGYLSRMLEAGCCDVCKRPLSELDRKNIQDLLDSFAVSSETSNILTGMRSELRRIVSSVRNYRKDLEAKNSAFAKAQDDLRRASEELSEIESQISNHSNVNRGQIKYWIETRSELERKISLLEREIGGIERETKSAKDLLNKNRSLLQAEIRKMEKSREAEKALALGEKAVRVLAKVEADTVAEVRNEMAARTEQLFKGLVWKGSKCDSIQLSDKYQLSLYDIAGFSCAGTCSAAERALLALSFTLAMHEVSGFQSPLFIDTPIARASGDNRANFAKTLVDVSRSKQIILTFTPDEYSEAISSEFDGVAAAYRRLVLDGNERVVTLKGMEDER